VITSGTVVSDRRKKFMKTTKNRALLSACYDEIKATVPFVAMICLKACLKIIKLTLIQDA